MKYFVKAEKGKLKINCKCDRLTDAAGVAQMYGGRIYCRRVKEKNARYGNSETVSSAKI